MTEYLASGFQFHNCPVLQVRKGKPRWAWSRKSIERHLWQRYCKLRVGVAYRYWVKDMSASKISREMGIKLSIVKSTIRMLSAV